jgi:precorrin-2 dehydrogenase/sirohydrochlorin ferrochelatase
MRFFPLNLDLRGMRVLVVGGGRVAGRKCLGLLRAVARPVVVAPVLCGALRRLAAGGLIEHQLRGFDPEDLAGAALAFAATSDPAVNRAVAAEARRRGIPVNIADAPELCDFTVPADLQRGDLLLTVSTGGASPALARRLRRELAHCYGREYALTLAILGAVRRKLLTGGGGNAYNKQILSALAGHDLVTLVRRNALPEIDQLLHTQLGPGYTLAELGIRTEDSP